MKMTDKELYNFSKSFDMIAFLFSKLKNLHIYRYSKFIDGSDSGMNCRFAKATKNALPEEHSDFLELMSLLKETISLYEKKYKEEVLNEKEK